jgi:hypothetical protein
VDKVKKHLDSAYYWLSKIPVTGESVDWMAMARQELRAAFQELPDNKPTDEVKQDG